MKKRIKRMPPDDRKRRIIRAAAKLCRGRVIRPSRAEFARSAGVSPSLISYYFGSMRNFSREVEHEIHGE